MKLYRKNRDKKTKPVFLVVQHLCPGGIEVLALNLLDKLRDRRELHIVALEGTKEKALADWPVLENHQNQLHFLNKKSGLSPWALLKLVAFFIRHRPLAVHTHHIGPMIYGGLAARLLGIRNLIHTEHDGWHLQKNGPLQSRVMHWLKPSIVAVADHVGLCVSKTCKVPMPNVVYNGIDVQYFSEGDKAAARHLHNLPQTLQIIGCAGRMEEVKGQKYLIEALQHLPVGVHVALAGDGSLKEALKSHAQTLNVEDRVHFLGRIDDMRNFYCALDIFCLPSLNEGFPLSPLEAQSCGVPAVLSDVGGCVEALCKDTGLLAQAGETKDLAEKLKMALDHQHNQSPRQFVLDHFDLNDVAGTYDALYTTGERENV